MQWVVNERGHQMQSENDTPRPARRVVVIAAGLAAAVLSGCSSSRVVHRDEGPGDGNLGGSWDLVLNGPMVVANSDPRVAPEYDRLAARMNRTDDALYPMDAWPQQPRPSLDRPYRTTIPTNSDSIQIYRNSVPNLRYYWYSDLY